MNETKNWKLATIILGVLLLVMLVCCFGAWLGGLVGYGLGRRGAHNDRNYQMPHIVPEPLPSIPSVPMPMLPELPEVPIAWLGVTFRTVDQGALIVTVIAGSPAEAAGLQANDIITQVDGRAVTETRPLNQHIHRYAPGDTVELTVLRDARERTITVQLGTQF